MTLRGSADEFPLDLVLRFLAGAGKSGRVTLRGARGDGAVTLVDGRISGAACGEDDGDSALGALLAIDDAEFEFDASAEVLPETLNGSLDEVLSRARQERDQLLSIREVIPSDDRVFALSDRAASRTRIELSSDQWRTLLAVNGDRDVPAMAAALGIKRRVALGLLAELVRAGTIDASTREGRSVLPPVTSPPTPPVTAAPPAPVVPAPAPVETAEQWSVAEQSASPEAETWNEPTPAPAPEPAVETWAAPEPEKVADSWSSTSDDSWSAPAPAPDDRLAALFGAPAPAVTEEPVTQSWQAPVEPIAAPPPPPPIFAPEIEVDEHTIIPATEEKKKGGLFGFGAKREAVPVPPPATAGASTRAGKLAAFTNALIAEYNTGRYGKQKLDSRITNLLLRVDEQADPVDRPMPLEGDTLSVAALDSGVLPESQAVPYIALLISQVFADAERAFGRDKAKGGYKTARQNALGKDALLDSPDLAARLPRV